MVLNYLERAAAALRAGDVTAGRNHIETCLTKLVIERAEQNVVLDEAARTPEQLVGDA